VGVSNLLQNVLGKNPKTTIVVIEEINTDNWGIASENVTERGRTGVNELRPMTKGIHHVGLMVSRIGWSFC